MDSELLKDLRAYLQLHHDLDDAEYIDLITRIDESLRNNEILLSNFSTKEINME